MWKEGQVREILRSPVDFFSANAHNEDDFEKAE